MNWKNELKKPFLYQEGKWVTLKEYVLLEKMKDDFEVLPANRNDVETFVKRHYLQTFPTGIKKIYAVYQKNNQENTKKMIGMIIYGVPFMTAAKFLEPEVTLRETLELKRLFIDDIGIKNLESFVIGQSLKLLKQDSPETKVVITFADDVQGHVGAIYQATNATYIGKSESGKHKYVYILRGNENAIKAKLKSQDYPKKELQNEELLNKPNYQFIHHATKSYLDAHKITERSRYRQHLSDKEYQSKQDFLKQMKAELEKNKKKLMKMIITFIQQNR